MLLPPTTFVWPIAYTLSNTRVRWFEQMAYPPSKHWPMCIYLSEVPELYLLDYKGQHQIKLGAIIEKQKFLCCFWTKINQKQRWCNIILHNTLPLNNFNA
jgi:hypothetical protein